MLGLVWFLTVFRSRHQSVSNSSSRGKSGIFYTKDPAGLVVMFRGKQVFRYKSIEEFIEAHIKGAKALEEKQEAELRRYYQDSQ